MTTLPDFIPRRTIAPGIITPGQLGALIEELRIFALRRGEVTIFPISGTIGVAPFVIDLRVCPIAIAAVARCFDYDPGVIAILDESQFEGLGVTVSKAHRAAHIIMTVSSLANATASKQTLTITDHH